MCVYRRVSAQIYEAKKNDKQEQQLFQEIIWHREHYRHIGVKEINCVAQQSA